MTRSAILYPRSSILDLQSLVRADAGAKDRADGRSFTAAGDPANDRAEHASGDAASRGVLTPAAGFDVAFLVNGLNALALVDLHDALPICRDRRATGSCRRPATILFYP